MDICCNETTTRCEHNVSESQANGSHIPRGKGSARMYWTVPARLPKKGAVL